MINCAFCDNTFEETGFYFTHLTLTHNDIDPILVENKNKINTDVISRSDARKEDSNVIAESLIAIISKCATDENHEFDIDILIQLQDFISVAIKNKIMEVATIEKNIMGARYSQRLKLRKSSRNPVIVALEKIDSSPL